MGYERLLTKFGHPLQGCLLALPTVLPPKERVDKFVLDITTQYPRDMDKLDEEVKAAMYTMQRTEGQRVQVTPASRRSLVNYGSSGPMQAWYVT